MDFVTKFLSEYYIFVKLVAKFIFLNYNYYVN